MTSSLYKNIVKSIKSKDIEVVSFDFFDTIMSRRVPYPKDIFWIMGARLSEKKLLSFDIPPERFQALRMQAEQKARELGASKEIGIIDIYRQFPDGFFKCTLEEAIRFEIDIEKEFLFPIDEMIKAINTSHRRGKKVIVVSDTYLNAEHLQYFWGDTTPTVDIKFFVSSEHRVGKYDSLFDVVLKKMQIQPSAILHSGDNYVSDIKVPTSKGVNTCFVPHGSALFWNTFNNEHFYANHLIERVCPEAGDLGITALRCKTSLYHYIEDIDKTGFFQYGSQVLGPVLATFVHWVRSTALEEDVDVIMPLMREGYMIEKLLSAYPNTVIRSAYFSRRVLFQAGLVKADKKTLESLRFGNLESSVSDYLELLGLYPDETPELYDDADLSIRDNMVFENLLQAIIGSDRIINLIRNRAADIRKGVVSHFQKLIATNTNPVKKIALVDVGWNGTIQRLLQRILDDEKIDVTLIGLYMMTTPAVNDLIFQGVLAKGYFVDGGYPESDFVSLSRTLEIFEQSCSPSHGSVLCHDIKTGEPLLKPDQIPGAQRADIDDIQEGIMLFHDLYRVHVPTDLSPKTLISIGEKTRPILRRAMLAPTLEEATMFANWVHDDNLASGGIMPILGGEYSRTFARYKTLEQYMQTPMDELYWPSGTLAIHDPERLKLLALSSIHRLPVDQLDTFNLNLSSELAVDNFTESNPESNFSTKNHQHLFRNASGRTYIRFEIPVSAASTLRWTPMAHPFEITIDSMLFSFRDKGGRITQRRIDVERALTASSQSVGMTHYSTASWSGRGDGCAFFFTNLRKLGVSGEGTMVIEIACRITLTFPTNETKTEVKFSNQFSQTDDDQIKQGLAQIEMVNDDVVKSGISEFCTHNGEISLSGWMLDKEMQIKEGDFFLRVTNSLGESRFIPMATIPRLDLAKHIKNNSVINCGFSLERTKLPTGRYKVSTIRSGNRMHLISKDSWTIIVE